MKKIGKVILALALCLSIFAGNSGMVLADELHKHCVCATSSCSETEHNGETEWTAWTSQDSLPTDSGYYYLTQDVNIRDGSNVTLYNNIHLCLNGHSITGSYGDNLIYVSGGTAFTITDCQNLREV